MFNLFSKSAFSKNGKSTIVAKNILKSLMMGQRIGLSSGDVKRINNMYQCSAKNIGWKFHSFLSKAWKIKFLCFKKVQTSLNLNFFSFPQFSLVCLPCKTINRIHTNDYILDIAGSWETTVRYDQCVLHDSSHCTRQRLPWRRDCIRRTLMDRSTCSVYKTSLSVKFFRIHRMSCVSPLIVRWVVTPIQPSWG